MRSFHGRELYSPIAASLFSREWPPAHGTAFAEQRSDPDTPGEIVYIDEFGDAMLGMSVDNLFDIANLRVLGQVLTRAATFAELAL